MMRVRDFCDWRVEVLTESGWGDYAIKSEIMNSEIELGEIHVYEFLVE